MAATESERRFEEYLHRVGLTARYEELPPGITKPVDYSLEIVGGTVRFDVKEWKQTRAGNRVGALDPCKPIRRKIDEGKRKFHQYKSRNEPCVLILCHVAEHPIPLDDFAILGAMFGNLGWVLPLPRSSESAPPGPRRPKLVFLGDGKLQAQKNTTISAIAVLDYSSPHGRTQLLALRKQEREEGRSYSVEKGLRYLQCLDEQHPDHGPVPRLTVYDNPYARIQLQEEFPTGPFDERFGWRDEYLHRTFVGVELNSLERHEAEPMS